MLPRLHIKNDVNIGLLLAKVFAGMMSYTTLVGIAFQLACAPIVLWIVLCVLTDPRATRFRAAASVLLVLLCRLPRIVKGMGVVSGGGVHSLGGVTIGIQGGHQQQMNRGLTAEESATCPSGQSQMGQMKGQRGTHGGHQQHDQKGGTANGLGSSSIGQIQSMQSSRKHGGLIIMADIATGHWVYLKKLVKGSTLLTYKQSKEEEMTSGHELNMSGSCQKWEKSAQLEFFKGFRHDEVCLCGFRCAS
uniref:Integral membrane protein n=1 Tax=Steinernema glaseri TaxID=37863 RepID=A0A1I7Z2B6_9BILA